jgi:hypothetical protein
MAASHHPGLSDLKGRRRIPDPASVPKSLRIPFSSVSPVFNCRPDIMPRHCYDGMTSHA